MWLCWEWVIHEDGGGVVGDGRWRLEHGRGVMEHVAHMEGVNETMKHALDDVCVAIGARASWRSTCVRQVQCVRHRSRSTVDARCSTIQLVLLSNACKTLPFSLCTLHPTVHSSRSATINFQLFHLLYRTPTDILCTSIPPVDLLLSRV